VTLNKYVQMTAPLKSCKLIVLQLNTDTGHLDTLCCAIAAINHDACQKILQQGRSGRSGRSTSRLKCSDLPCLMDIAQGMNVLLIRLTFYDH
jgi:hypothetical protein